MNDTTLNGVSVLVAGAGLAGLAAARDLMARGAAVTVIDVRDRVGGRVWTIRDGFAEGQHAEAGGDLIDEEQHAIRDLAGEAGIEADAHPEGRVRLRARRRGRRAENRRAQCPARMGTAVAGAARPDRAVQPCRAALGFADHRDSRAPVGRRPGWTKHSADADLRETATGLRGFFLADPDELSLIALVDQFAENDTPARGGMFRIEGGNDQLATALAAPLGDRAAPERGRRRPLPPRQGGAGQREEPPRALADHLRLRRARAAGDAAAADPDHAGAAGAAARGDRPAEVRPRDQDAAAVLEAVLARVGRPRAFGSPLPFGAVWDGNEEQRGRAGILTLLAGGGASDAHAGDRRQARRRGLADALDWLGSKRRGAARLAADRLGAGSVRARRLRLSSIPASIRRCGHGCRGRRAGCSSPASTPASNGRAT